MGRHRGSQLPVQHQVFSAELFYGPLPRPGDLRQYEEAVPGAADRIIRQFEEQSAHRRTLETKVVDSNIEGERRGVVAATFVTALFVLGGFTLIGLGIPQPGIYVLAWAGAQVTGSFIVTILGRRSELRRKREMEQRQGPR